MRRNMSKIENFVKVMAIRATTSEWVVSFRKREASATVTSHMSLPAPNWIVPMMMPAKPKRPIQATNMV